jgi:L-lactate utilization protein LutB
LFGTLGKGRRRFENELKRMKKTMKWYGMMVEGCEDEVLRKQKFSTMVVNQIYHALSSFELQGLHIYYAKTKDDARDWILSRLTRFYVHVRRGDVE